MSKKRKVNSQEAQRRKQQSIQANPVKYQKQCMKNGCCKNCSRNEIRDVKARSAVQSAWGSYFQNNTAGNFGTTTVKKHVCAATGNPIVNEYVRCSMWTNKKEIIDAKFEEV